MKKILFLCTHNSARSQMAEALVNHFFKDRFQAFSAGTEPRKVNPFAIRVMQELGIDISKSRSKPASEFLGETFDQVVTVCDTARQNCPFFPGARVYHHQSFPDPSIKTGTEREILSAFRKIRDGIKKWLEDFFKNFPEENHP